MNISDIFGGIKQAVVGTPTPAAQNTTSATNTTGTTPAQGAPANPGNIPNSAANATTAANGIVPAGTATESPLDQFSTLFKVEPNSEPKPNTGFNIDPNKLLEAAKQTDFTSSLTPEIQNRIKAGGDDGIRASIELMNSMAQASFANSAHAAAKIAEEAIRRDREAFRKELPQLIKTHNLRDSTATENPALSHPAAQPIVQAIQRQLQVKHPSATEAQLRSMVGQYFDGLAAVIAPPAAAKGSSKDGKGGRAEEDWSAFLQ